MKLFVIISLIGVLAVSYPMEDDSWMKKLPEIQEGHFTGAIEITEPQVLKNFDKLTPRMTVEYGDKSKRQFHFMTTNAHLQKSFKNSLHQEDEQGNKISPTLYEYWPDNNRTSPIRYNEETYPKNLITKTTLITSGSSQANRNKLKSLYRKVKKLLPG